MSLNSTQSPQKIAITTIVAIILVLGLLTSCKTMQAQEEKAPIRERILERIQQRRNNRDLNNQAGISGTITLQGMQRTYYLYAPPSYRSNRPMPLILAFHGGRGQGERLAQTTGFNDLADREGFIVVYPDGIDKHWNDGVNTPGFDSSIDDVGFVKALIDEIGRSKNIDRRRIYATGISNGGFFTLRLACEMSERIAAFAPVAATMPVKLKSKCNLKKPVSILMIGGTNDRFVPWEGGQAIKGGDEIMSVVDTFEFWKQQNACVSREQVNRLPNNAPRDGTQVESSTYSGCRANAEVRLLTIEGGGHTWPGGYGQPRAVVGQTSGDINASEEIWNFFKRHALP
ncbi:hydrolase [Planktothrix sp. FACHB-1355]|uniref:Hydrolase n=2 Tax=Cyanophyceae TaxID=3028117 RepID=A0A926ZJT4_9CYAN|nr:hydrolase [Aerosakkonema funiforme FACHB-1375]MBD3561101.1 hydrolase [Planktothrix sp. FACHB-1355]